MSVQATISVDPACPWCWLTSRWAVQVERIRDVHFRFDVLSLAEVNRGGGDEERYRQYFDQATRALLVLVAVDRREGNEAMRRVYAAQGEARHERGEALTDETIRAGLAEAGLDPAIADEAWSDEEVARDLQERHRAVVAGGGFGVPTLRVGDTAPAFGPVVRTRLDDEAAGRLWDNVAGLLADPDFYELKRERTSRPDVGAARREAAAAAR